MQLECFVREGGEECVVVVREGGKVDRHTLAGQALHQLTRACQERFPAVQLECFVREGGEECVVVVREGGKVDRPADNEGLPQLGLQTTRE